MTFSEFSEEGIIAYLQEHGWSAKDSLQARFGGRWQPIVDMENRGILKSEVRDGYNGYVLSDNEPHIANPRGFMLTLLCDVRGETEDGRYFNIIRTLDPEQWSIIGGWDSNEIRNAMNANFRTHGAGDLWGYGRIDIEVGIPTAQWVEKSVHYEDAFDNPRRNETSQDGQRPYLLLAYQPEGATNTELYPIWCGNSDIAEIIGLDDREIEAEIDRAAHLSNISTTGIKRDTRAIWFHIPYSVDEMVEMLIPTIQVARDNVLPND